MPAQEEYEDVVIETAFITNVNMSDWSVDLMTMHSSKKLTSVPWISLYLHQERGEGIHIVPEVGAQCLLCFPSDGEASPYVLGYIPIPKGDDYRANRPNMNPGDMGMITRDGNFVMVRRGGVIQIGATSVAQRIYLPVNNTIRDFAQNYSLTTFGGEAVWEEDSKKRTQGKTPTRAVYRIKEYAEETKGGKEFFPVTITIGSTLPHDDKTKRSGEKNLSGSGISGAGKPLLEVDISRDGDKFNLAVDAQGNIYVKSYGSAKWDFEKDFKVSIGGDRETVIKGQDKLTADAVIVEARRHHATYSNSREKVGSKAIEGKVSLGDHAALAPAVRGGADFIKAFTTAGNFLAQVPSPSGKIDAPVIPGPGLIAMLQKLFSNSVSIGS